MPRPKSLALAKQAKAVELHKEGHSWDEVANGAGFAHRGTAYKVVMKALREHIVEDIDSYREVELERLSFLESELLIIATTSKSDSAKIRALGEVRAIGRDRCKLLGLYDHTPQAQDEPKTLFDLSLGQLRKGNTCRISGDSECGFEPKDHSQQCVRETLGFVPYAEGEASEKTVTSLPSFD